MKAEQSITYPHNQFATKSKCNKKQTQSKAKHIEQSSANGNEQSDLKRGGFLKQFYIPSLLHPLFSADTLLTPSQGIK